MPIVRSSHARPQSGTTPGLSAAAVLLLIQLVGCAGVISVTDPITPAAVEAERPTDEVDQAGGIVEVSPQAEPWSPGERHIRRATRPPGGRYQIASLRGSSGWVVLDTETGKFEHWVPVAGTSRYHVFGCKFEGGCSIFDKRSVDRGLDP